MRPWKSFVGSVGVVALLTAGAFGAGSGVIPFSHASESTESTVPTEVVDEAPAGDETAPPAGSSDEVGEDTTTTTTGPDTDAPGTDTDTDTDVDDDADDSDADDSEADDEEAPPVIVVDVPAEVPPAPDADQVPPATPAENDAPVVCAAAAESECGPVETTDAGFEARVQRCQAWWNRLADRLDDRKPKWAERARRVAERCEAMVTRRQERHDRWHEKHDRKMKGDHNCDGHPDNGWHTKDRPECPTPPAAAEGEDGQEPDEDDRPKTSPDRGRKSRP